MVYRIIGVYMAIGSQKQIAYSFKSRLDIFFNKFEIIVKEPPNAQKIIQIPL